MIALMIAGAAIAAAEAAGYPVDENGLVDLHQDHMVELLAVRGEHAVERLGLRHGARKAVEDKTAFAIMGGAIGLRDPLRDHLYDDVIRNQPAGIVDRL